tara:strand:- start:1755 stop:2648 length:894 start_codon:yes stop_codon:yes gene_type:complete
MSKSLGAKHISMFTLDKLEEKLESANRKTLQQFAKQNGIAANLSNEKIKSSLIRSKMNPPIKLSPGKKQSIKDYLYRPYRKLPLPPDIITQIEERKLSLEEKSRVLKRNIDLIKRLQNNATEITELKENHPNYLFDIDYKVLIKKLNIQNEQDLNTKYFSTIDLILKYRFLYKYLRIESFIDSINAVIVNIEDNDEDDTEENEDEINVGLDILRDNIIELNKNFKKYASYGITIKKNKIKEIQNDVDKLNKDLKKLYKKHKTTNRIRVNLGKSMRRFSSRKRSRSISSRKTRRAKSY